MKKDFYLSLLFFFIIFFGSLYLTNFREISLGAEYRCIAEALVRGDGFSDPFCTPGGSSSPTAWMPPFLSYLLAGTMFIFGTDSFASTFVLMLITKGALALTLFFLLRLANEINSRHRHICILFFSGYILMNPGPFLLSFHDIWLIAVACMAIPYFLYFHFVKKSLGLAPVFVLAVLLPLISPILSLSFVCLVGWLFLSEYYSYWKKHKEVNGLLHHANRSVPKLILLASAFLLPVLIWGSRNYLVFDKFIPVKSNLWFDFYQANVYDEDGLVTGFTFANFHPIKNKERLKEYQQTGETRLMEEHKEKSVHYVKENTPDYLRKVGNRLFATFIYSKHPYDEDFKVDEEGLTQSDIQQLRKSGIISATNSLNMQMSPATFNNRINSLDVRTQSAIASQWHSAKAAYENEFSSPTRILEYNLISGIPFLAWLVCLLLVWRFDRGRELFVLLSILYLSYLMPYALISSHTRYQIPLSPLFSLIMYFALILAVRQLSSTLVDDRTAPQQRGKQRLARPVMKQAEGLCRRLMPKAYLIIE